MAMFGAKAGSIAGFNPTQPSWIDKVGLIGDILTGNPVTKNRLNDDFAFQQAQYQAQHPNPVKLSAGDSYIDPLSGKVLYSAPQQLDSFGRDLVAAHIDPNSPQGVAAYAAKVAAVADPLVTLTLPNQGVYSGPRSGLADAIGGRSTAAPPGVTFTPRASGGVAPATGPGGFPLYPVGH